MEFKILSILNEWSNHQYNEDVKNNIPVEQRSKCYPKLESMPEVFLRALTHWSVNKKWNYEDLEYIGDRSFKYMVNVYLKKYYKDQKIKNRAKFLARKSMIIESEIVLPTFTRKLGLVDFIKYDKQKIKDEHIEFFKIEEDVFEAFVGAWEETYGTIENMKPLINWLLDSVNIEDITYDPVAEFNEIKRKHKLQLYTKTVEAKNEFITYGTIPKLSVEGKSKEDVKKRLPNCKTRQVKGKWIGYMPSLTVQGVHREKLRSKKMMYKKLVDRLTKQYLRQYEQEQTFQ